MRWKLLPSLQFLFLVALWNQEVRYEVQNYKTEANTWFSEISGRSCTFVRCMSAKNHHCLRKGSNIAGLCREARSKLKFANEAQLLLISERSVDDLNSRLSNNQEEKSGCEQQAQIDAMRFRPNLVVSGAKPFAEYKWSSLHVGKARFTMAVEIPYIIIQVILFSSKLGFQFQAAS